MDQDKYNLNWDTFGDHLRQMLHEMRRSNDLTDVTLVCDDKVKFKAHKIVLSACSPVFKSIIDDLPNINSVIYLRGVKQEEMESILEFMYLGVTTLNQDRMDEFLNVSTSLEIKEISKTVKMDQNSKSETEEYDPLNQEFKKERGRPKSDGQSEYEVNFKTELQSNSAKSYECPGCDKVFRTYDGMKIHHDAIHKGITYSCNQCDFKFTREASLKAHIEAIHENVKYQCKECNFIGSRANLRQHKARKHK